MNVATTGFLRRVAAVVLVGLGVGGTLVLGQGAAAADPLVAPDWGMSCLIAKPGDNAAFSYIVAHPAGHVVNGTANCRYTRISSGNRSAGLLAGYRTVDSYVSWDQLCQLSYGPDSHHEGQQCTLPDGGTYYVNVATPQAQARGI